MRVRRKVAITIAEAAGADPTFSQAASGGFLGAQNLDGFTEQSSGTANLAASGAQTIPLGAISDARALYLKGTGDFDVVINGGSTIHCKRPLVDNGPTKADDAVLYMEASITSVVVTAVEAALITYALWGDPA